MKNPNNAHPLGEIYSHHHRWLVAWLYRRLSCDQQAADLAQDTFLRLLNRRQLPELSKPRSLLTHIAKALMIDHWRRQEVERAYLEALALRPEAVAPSPEARELILESLFAIERMLREMPETTREIFLLAQLDDFTYGEIAQRLGVSLITVKRHMRNGFCACLKAL